jgi:predicted GNAT family N-acyltransferase
MINSIKILRFKIGQEEAISNLIRKVFDEFVAIDYTDEGNSFFYDWISPKKIADRQAKQRTILVAMDGQEIVGMIEIRDNNHISLLFVEKEYHGLSIATKLFRESLKDCIRKEPDLDKFYVYASPFSVPVYKKLGFIATDFMQERFGIKYMPMEMAIK